MGKTRKFIPDLRIRKPYKREPKLRVNVHVEAEDVDETTEDYRYHFTSSRESERDGLPLSGSKRRGI